MNKEANDENENDGPNVVGVFLSDGIEAKVCVEIAKRKALGMAKYGTSVADNPLSLRHWLQHALEECLDQAIYLRRAIAEIDAAETANV